ncbi:uncharacterized membrane protein YcaP (DUF421 family) [Oikeobacillus pervagus]|uniref:Uncharacterized membrane protein YcaP (DUF421 family) n=1 Tax=Oikeobacillus pervagus TaxID=1325931 RepID=A0AAJ1T0Q1_9BACI|nr:uncharacterized membrane protein YcaP (DUF421 family) [Oikeobacillus pervagus]
MDYFIIIARTIILYLLILIIFRLMGKREIGELSILDLVVFVMMGELAVIGIEKHDDPLMHSIVPMLILLTIQILFALFSLKSKKFRDIIDGHPVIIIDKGKIDENAMRKQRYNFDDLLLQLREKDIRNIADVEFAILEPSGNLSVMKKENKRKDGSFTLPLIIDGEIQEDHMNKLNLNEFWLKKELRQRGFKSIKEISFCSFQDGQFFIDLKDPKE